jgi:hypothetical protein
MTPKPAEKQHGKRGRSSERPFKFFTQTVVQEEGCRRYAE